LQTKSLSLYVSDIGSKAKSFEPYLAKVDEICEAVSQIEQTVMLLDDYTMRCAALVYLPSLADSRAADWRPSLPLPEAAIVRPNLPPNKLSAQPLLT
jgi:hypothetical protein